MSLPKDDAAVLSVQWTEGVLLKRDVFSTVERGRFRGRDGEVDAVLRRLDQVPWWSYIVARHLFARERRATPLIGRIKKPHARETQRVGDLRDLGHIRRAGARQPVFRHAIEHWNQRQSRAREKAEAGVAQRAGMRAAACGVA